MSVLIFLLLLKNGKEKDLNFITNFTFKETTTRAFVISGNTTHRTGRNSTHSRQTKFRPWFLESKCRYGSCIPKMGPGLLEKLIQPGVMLHKLKPGIVTAGQFKSYNHFDVKLQNS